MKPSAALLLAGALAGCAERPEQSSAATGPRLIRVEAWARAQADTTRPGAAYISFTNAGTQELEIAGISCEPAGMAHLHRSEQQGGLMVMRGAGRVAVAPGARLEMEPGALHVMLMDLAGPVAAGRRFNCLLEFSGGETFPVEVEARAN